VDLIVLYTGNFCLTQNYSTQQLQGRDVWLPLLVILFQYVLLESVEVFGETTLRDATRKEAFMESQWKSWTKR